MHETPHWTVMHCVSKSTTATRYTMFVLCSQRRVDLSIFFFFSSRRRHTRFDCDWSSDVCSSDLKEHRTVQELEATVAQQQKEIQALTASLKEQASQIQKVSAQLEVSKPTRQMVINNP